MGIMFRAIQNESGSIELSDLFNEREGKYYKEPALHFKKAKYESFWDNSDYVYKFLKSLSKGKKLQISELKKYCKDNDYDFEQTREELIEMFNQTKKFKWWKNCTKK